MKVRTEKEGGGRETNRKEHELWVAYCSLQK